MIRIASAQGFWGDWPQAPALQVRGGQIDYLVFDYLAEVTMSILEKQRRRDPSKGYATDFVDVISGLLPELMEKKIRVISSAGGVNPVGCAKAIIERAEKLMPGQKLTVGVVHGDNIIDKMDSLELAALDPNAPALADVRSRLLSANIYFGAAPIVQAIKGGADIIVCGRVTDTALTMAPIIEHFNVSFTNYNALATGTVAGHVLECGAQASGGNFLGKTLSVDDLVEIGFPIAEVHSPNEVIITKHESLGGLVSAQTVKEQLLYEIGDPREYLTPDVTVDFSSINVTEIGRDRVRLHGIHGGPPPETLKVSCSYEDGYLLAGTLVYTWPEAAMKARRAGELVRSRARALGLEFDDFRIETIGAFACHEGVAGAPKESGEVTLRIAARGRNKVHLEALGKEIIPLVLTGPPGATGYAGGRPKPHDILAYWPGLISRKAVQPIVEFFSTGAAAKGA
jgi:hypothetical protein